MEYLAAAVVLVASPFLVYLYAKLAAYGRAMGHRQAVRDFHQQQQEKRNGSGDATREGQG